MSWKERIRPAKEEASVSPSPSPSLSLCEDRDQALTVGGAPGPEEMSWKERIRPAKEEAPDSPSPSLSLCEDRDQALTAGGAPVASDQNVFRSDSKEASSDDSTGGSELQRRFRSKCCSFPIGQGRNAVEGVLASG
ncbi:hypothetical protein MA16_Dca003227 [Dendrobium catenatum]|uniref:Uncharacterized protein n=1 Tax=Dendrobium catenatum TaxID=906689 RepID=A0A2I0XC32_9ASPA|nr:hypothetical protein MA16_Dca003227 [Dendrobium catenatum]